MLSRPLTELSSKAPINLRTLHESGSAIKLIQYLFWDNDRVLDREEKISKIQLPWNVARGKELSELQLDSGRSFQSVSGAGIPVVSDP